MTKFMIKGTFLTKEQEGKIKEFVQEVGLELFPIKEEEEAFIYPKSLYQKQDIVRHERIEVEEKKVLDSIEKIFEEYAVEFKKNNVDIPYYLSFETSSEYNDEGGTFNYVSAVVFYDKNKQMVRLDFEVPTEYGSDIIDDLITEEVSEGIDVDYVNDLFYDIEYIPVPRGV